MNAKANGVGLGLDRVNGLLGWWGIPNGTGGDNIEGQMQRFRLFASDLQKAYGDAYSHQMEALSSANERLVHSMQDFLRCRRPQEVVTIELNILATFLEGASLHAQTWVGLTQKVHDCCTALARETAEEVRRQVTENGGPKPMPRPGTDPE